MYLEGEHPKPYHRVWRNTNSKEYLKGNQKRFGVCAVRTLGCFLKPDSKKAGQTRQWRKQQVAQLVVETQKVKINMEIFKRG